MSRQRPMQELTVSMTLYFLPGIGASDELFNAQLQAFPQAQRLPWLTPEANDTLESYGRKMAATLAAPAGSYTLVGLSFGGMVALEMAKHCSPHCTLLISSCRSRDAVTPRFKLQEKMSRTLPDSVLKAAIRTAGPAFFAMNERLSPEQDQWLRTMSERIDIDFFRWSCRAVSEWRFDGNLEGLCGSVFQIHGRGDYVIPCVEGHADTVLEDGKHLIQYTHADQVNEYIRTRTEAPL